MKRKRIILAAAFAALALAGAAAAAISAARLEARLSEERILAQAEAMALDVAMLVDAGAPIRDYTGFTSGAKAFLAAEQRLAGVELRDRDGVAVFAAARAGGAEGEAVTERPGAMDCAAARCLGVAIMSRNELLGRLGALGVVEVAVAPADPFRLFDGASLIALAAIATLGVIGVIYFLVIADDAALTGAARARAWSVCALPPALVIGAWLVASSGDAYREKARVTADVLADRLRAAVDIQVDPVGFSGLEELFRAVSAASAGGGPQTRFQLREGRRVVVDVAASDASGSEATVGTGGLFAGLDLSVARSIRPRTLAYPALSIVAVVPWSGVALAAPGDHAIALACLLVYLLGPAALLLLFGGRGDPAASPRTGREPVSA